MREENPFEDAKVAQEWVSWAEKKSREGSRHTDIYARVRDWLAGVKPKRVVDIGAGQGVVSEYMGLKKDTEYIGVEPSIPLVERAKELYKEKNKRFIVGNAYDLPILDNFSDAALSVYVWLHLENLEKASNELSRILKPKGKFLIITANPKTYNVWKSFYVNPREEGNRVVGEFRMRKNPTLSKHTFYLHPLEEITKSLNDSGLVIDGTETFGYGEEYGDDGLHILFKGHKD